MRPAWMGINPKDYLMPMIRMVQVRHLADLKALIPIKYSGVAEKIHEEWCHVSRLVTFGSYILSPGPG